MATLIELKKELEPYKDTLVISCLEIVRLIDEDLVRIWNLNHTRPDAV